MHTYLEIIRKWYMRLGQRIESGHHPQAIHVSDCHECTCLNCGTTFRGNYCPGCGQKADTGRLTLGHALNNLLGVLASADKGLVHTLHELMMRPGYMMRDYVRGHRVEYVRPIQLLFLLATIYLVVHYALFLHAEEASIVIMSDDEGNPLPLTGFLAFFQGAFDSIFSNRAYVSLVSAGLLWIPMWLAFRPTRIGRETTLVEFFFVMVYVSCLQMVFCILQLPFDLIKGQEENMGIGISFFFMVWSFRQYFLVSWRSSLLHSLLGAFYLGIPFFIFFLCQMIAER